MSISDPGRSGDFFDLAYRETPPWDVGETQPALIALLDEYPPAGPILDVRTRRGRFARASCGHCSLPSTGGACWRCARRGSSPVRHAVTCRRSPRASNECLRSEAASLSPMSLPRRVPHRPRSSSGHCLARGGMGAHLARARCDRARVSVPQDQREERASRMIGLVLSS
jgi:hypothetical protein